MNPELLFGKRHSRIVQLDLAFNIPSKDLVSLEVDRMFAQPLKTSLRYFPDSVLL